MVTDIQLRARAELELRRRRKRERVRGDRPSLESRTPDWAQPLLKPCRYKGAKGGRGGGKSHQYAEMIVEAMCDRPDLRVVCIREFQKSLKFSAKMLIETKIESLGVSDLFDITLTEIRRKGGKGIAIFQGMQDHTADSIKSLEGFGIAWVEEAQKLSARSLSLLRPTIREPDSEIWFSWNPEQPTDPVDQFLCGESRHPNSIVVTANYSDNPFLPEELREEAETDRARDLDYFNHVWMGAYNVKSDAQILGGKCIIDTFTPGADWDGPYLGADWGFASDPTALVKCWIWGDRLFVEYESYAHHLELSDTAARWRADVPGCEDYVIRADSSRPESISHVRRDGIPRLTGVEKWAGSVEDGIAHLRSYEKIVIHERCVHTQEESRLYHYKVDRYSGDILPVIVDAHNHCCDGIRYALAPLIRGRQSTFNPPVIPSRSSSRPSAADVRRMFG